MSERLKDLVELNIDIEGEDGKRDYVRNVSSSLKRAYQICEGIAGSNVLHQLSSLIEVYTDKFFAKSPLSINANSGLPVFSLISSVAQSASDADRKLSFLSKEDDIIKTAKESVYEGLLPEKQISQLIERRYFERLKGFGDLEILNSALYISPPLIEVGSIANLSDIEEFEVKLKGFDATRGVFSDYKLDVYQKVKSSVLGLKRLQPIMEEKKGDKTSYKLSKIFESRVKNYFTMLPRDIWEDIKKVNQDITPTSVSHIIYGPFRFYKNSGGDGKSLSLQKILEENKHSFVFSVSHTVLDKRQTTEDVKEKQTRYVFCSKDIEKKLMEVIAEEKETLSKVVSKWFGSKNGPEVNYQVYEVI